MCNIYQWGIGEDMRIEIRLEPKRLIELCEALNKPAVGLRSDCTPVGACLLSAPVEFLISKEQLLALEPIPIQ